jgi:ankyrin repeat protein
MAACQTSATSTPFLCLPPELLYYISDYFASLADVNSIARCNRVLYGLLNAFLYRRNMRNCGGSALMWAAEKYRSTTARNVFKLCEGIEISADYLSKALVLALKNCSWGVMKVLIANGADANTQGSGLGNILQAASWNGDLEFVRTLLAGGANVKVQAGHFGNALTAAAWYGHEGVAELLIRNGADVNAQSGSYANALQAAASAGRQTMVKLLVNRGADVNSIGGLYGTALQAACCRCDKQVVRILLQAGADPGIQGPGCENALALAFKRRDVAMLTLMMTWSTSYLIGKELVVLLSLTQIAFWDFTYSKRKAVQTVWNGCGDSYIYSIS